MTARELFQAIGEVEDTLVLDADAVSARRAPVLTVVRRLLPLAACLCVAAGGIWAWHSGLVGGSSGAVMADNGRSADTADAGVDTAAPVEQEAAAVAEDAADAASPASEDSLTRSVLPEREEAAAAAGGADTICQSEDALYSGSQPMIHAPFLPDTLQAALRGENGAGRPVLLAYSVDDLYFADPLAGDIPAALPVYRSAAADHTVHEAEMRAALEQALAGLGVSERLSDSAVLETGSADAEDWQRMLDKAAAQGRSALDGESGYWAGAATLTLRDNNDLTAAGVASITVGNDLTVHILFSESGAGTQAGIDPVGDRADAQAQAQAIRSRHTRLLQALGADQAAIEGGDFDVHGVQSGVFTTFYRQEAGSTPARDLCSLYYAAVRVSTLTDGSLSAVHWDAAGPGRLLGEYALLDEAAARAMLADGYYLGGDERVDGAAAAQQYLRSRLVYSPPDAALHVPMWEFLVEAGPAREAEAAAPGLKEYAFYYVPAVDSDTLLTLLEAGE